jgi:hypothetical protein
MVRAMAIVRMSMSIAMSLMFIMFFMIHGFHFRSTSARRKTV